MDIDELYQEMARLSVSQLEHIRAFISQQDYKREGRPPNLQERKLVLAEIRKALAAAPDEEPLGIQRLRESGLLDD